MGKHIYKQYPFRTDETTIKKLDFIADKNTRTRNQQIEHLAKICISEYEAKYGELIINDDGTVHERIGEYPC